jgi:predicted methyltransferase
MSKMLLMDNPSEAERDGEADTAEVLALVPPLALGAKIIEFAAGVGRFTPHLARIAGPTGRVVAYDFVADFCNANLAQCRALGLTQVDVRAEDVLEAQLPGDNDLVFASWIFMYLSNDEVHRTLRAVTHALKPGGVLVFRESCVKVHQDHPGDWPRFPGVHPCRYRSAQWYTEALRALPGRTTVDAHRLKVWDDPADPNEQPAWVWQRT